MRLAFGLLTGHSKNNFKLIPSMIVVPVASCSNLTFDPLHVHHTYDLECNQVKDHLATLKQQFAEKTEKERSAFHGSLCQEAGLSSETDWRTQRREG